MGWFLGIVYMIPVLREFRRKLSTINYTIDYLIIVIIRTIKKFKILLLQVNWDKFGCLKFWQCNNPFSHGGTRNDHTNFFLQLRKRIKKTRV